MFCTGFCERNPRNFQNRSGVGTLVSREVGSNTRWNQFCASAKRWLLLRCTATMTGM